MHNKFFLSGFSTLFTSIVSIPLSIITSIIIARNLGPFGKGVFDLVIATSSLLGMLLGLSLPSGIVYVVAQSQVISKGIIPRLGIIALLQGFIAFILLLIIRNFTFSKAFLPQEMGSWVIVAIILILIFSIMASYIRSIMIGQQQIIRVNKIDILNRIVYFFVIIIAILILNLSGKSISPTYFIWIQIGLTFLGFILFFIFLIPLLSAQPEIPSIMKKIFSFSFPCYLGNLAQFLNYRLDVFIVSFFLGVTNLGIYTLGVTIAQLIWLFSNSFATVLLPNIAASREDPMKNSFRSAQIARLSFLISALSAIGLAIIAPVIPLVYGANFQQSISVLWFLLPGIVAFSLVNVLASYIAGIGRPKINFIFSLVGLCFTIFLDLLLIPNVGIIGASVTSTISYSISALLTVLYFKKITNIPVKEILFITQEDKCLIISMKKRIIGILKERFLT